MMKTTFRIFDSAILYTIKTNRFQNLNVVSERFQCRDYARIAICHAAR